MLYFKTNSRALKSVKAASQTPDTDHTLKPPSYIDKATQLSKQTAQVGNLQLHYQRNNQNKLNNQKYAYYRVVDSKQQHHMGMLDQYGKDMLSGLPYGPVGVYYGLIKVDADIEAHSQLGKEHQQLIQNSKKSRSNYRTNQSTAAKQRAALKKKLWGEGWAYTKAFFEGFKEGAESLLETTVNTLSAPFTALDELANTMVDCLAQGNIEPLKQDYHKLETGIEPTADDFAKLARLMTDPECLLMIVNFPKRYFAADSALTKYV